MTGNKIVGRWVLSVALVGGAAAAAIVPDAMAQNIVWKRCTGCNRMVPITSQVGEYCPHCGAYWGSESTTYVPGGESSGWDPSYYFAPRNSMERMAFYHAMVRQQMIQQEMLRQQMVQYERQQRRQRFAERAEVLREEEQTRREANWEQIRQRNELLAEESDPRERAERNLATADRLKHEGELKAAICLYRLVTRSAPAYSDAAALAHAALQRLGVE